MPDGKICYLEIPAADVDVSAPFYSDVFGWTSRLRGDGHRAFADTTGAVSGSWVLGRPPSRGAHGEAFATFLDPAGNLLGLYQAPRR